MILPQFSGRKVFNGWSTFSSFERAKEDAEFLSYKQTKKEIPNTLHTEGTGQYAVLDDVGLPHHSVYLRDKRNGKDVGKFFSWNASRLDFYVRSEATPDELAQARELRKKTKMGRLTLKVQEQLSKIGPLNVFRDNHLGSHKAPSDEKTL